VIRRAELDHGRIADVLVRDAVIAAIGTDLPADGATVIDAAGARLLPGLHDHHLHVVSAAAARASIDCGPPQVVDAAGLARVLVPGTGWLRGVGYHESVAGMLDRATLDAMVADRPVRVQHRSGRMWFFNSAGIDALLASGLDAPAGLDRDTGRLFDEDRWLRSALAGTPPDLAPIGRDLARYGVTGLTDMSPANGADEAALLGTLIQRVVVAGTLDLPTPGPFKLHLHETAFPDWDETVTAIRRAHDQGRGTAIHCVTEAELVFALGVLGEAGIAAGDRIEHASVVPEALIGALAGLAVVVQPQFVHERGDAYLADIPSQEWPWLYRLESLRAAGLVMAAGSDAPFGGLDPWAAMAAAVNRTTRDGRAFGPDEALSPEAALALYLADPLALGTARRVAVGAAADLCLLDGPWADVREHLSADRVRATLIGGRVVHDRIDQAPVQRGARADAPA
jgi:predicted amidohydrolase YtcJ